MEEFDVSEPKQVKRRKDRYKLAQEKEAEELRQILDTSAGRWFLWRLLEQCGLFKTLSAYEPHRMAIMSGQRDIGLWIIEKINEADPEGYMRLVKEANGRREYTTDKQ